MDEVFAFIDDATKRMNRPIKDLDDIRIVMGSLREIRERQIDIDMMIIPIEVMFFLFTAVVLNRVFSIILS